MPCFSQIWGVEVRDEIAREFTTPDGTIDDNLAGLHEVRARMMEQEAQKTPADQATELAEEQKALEAEGWQILRREKNRPAA